MRVVSASQQIQRLRRELGSHEAAAPQDANRTRSSSAFPRIAGSKTPPESKNTFSANARISVLEPRVQSRLKSGAGNTPARAKPDAANRGETACNRAVSRYRSAMFKKTLPTNFVAAERAQGKITLSPPRAPDPCSTLLPNPSLKRSANGSPPGPVRGAVAFSTARAWRATVGSRLARTLGFTNSLL